MSGVGASNGELGAVEISIESTATTLRTSSSPLSVNHVVIAGRSASVVNKTPMSESRTILPRRSIPFASVGTGAGTAMTWANRQPMNE